MLSPGFALDTQHSTLNSVSRTRRCHRRAFGGESSPGFASTLHYSTTPVLRIRYSPGFAGRSFSPRLAAEGVFCYKSCSFPLLGCPSGFRHVNEMRECRFVVYDVAATIVTYNSNPDDVVRAVTSFRQARLSTFLHVVDNASPGDYAARLQQRLDVPILRSGGNYGFGYGHNVGFRRAPASRYYLVLNPDIVIPPGSLETMVAYLEAHPEIGLLTPRILSPAGIQQHLNKRNPTVFDLAARRFLPAFLQRQRWIRRRMDRYVMLDCGYDEPLEVPYISGCFMLFRTETLRETGLFDEQFFLYLEDADITRRVREKARAVYFPGACVTHKWSRGSHRSWKLTWVTMRSAVTYFRKWGWQLV